MLSPSWASNKTERRIAYIIASFVDRPHELQKYYFMLCGMFTSFKNMISFKWKYVMWWQPVQWDWCEWSNILNPKMLPSRNHCHSNILRSEHVHYERAVYQTKVFQSKNLLLDTMFTYLLGNVSKKTSVLFCTSGNWIGKDIWTQSVFCVIRAGPKNTRSSDKWCVEKERLKQYVSKTCKTLWDELCHNFSFYHLSWFISFHKKKIK